MCYRRPPHHFGRVDKQHRSGNPPKYKALQTRAIQLLAACLKAIAIQIDIQCAAIFENGRYDNFPFARGINELPACLPACPPVLHYFKPIRANCCTMSRMKVMIHGDDNSDDTMNTMIQELQFLPQILISQSISNVTKLCTVRPHIRAPHRK